MKHKELIRQTPPEPRTIQCPPYEPTAEDLEALYLAESYDEFDEEAWA